MDTSIFLEAPRATLFLSALGACALVWAVVKFTRRAPQLPKDIPYVRFEDGDDSYQRYFKDTRGVLSLGYNRYSKKGQSFSMYNAANSDLPLLVLPTSYLDEVKTAHKDKLSLQKALDQRGGLDKLGGFLLSDEVIKVVKVAIARAVNQLIPELHIKCSAAYTEFMPPCADWTPAVGFQLMLRVWTRMISHVMVGPELSQSDEWMKEMESFVPIMVKGLFTLRKEYRKSTYWMAKYLCDDVKEIYRLRGRLAKLIKPLLDERLAIAAARTEKRTGKGMDLHADAIMWFVDEYGSKGVKPSADLIAREMIMLSLASVLGTASTTLMIVFDLMDRPESMKEVKEEMARVREECGEKVTRQALGKLVIFDSFIKESQRIKPINQLSMHRLAAQDYTFKDGLKVSAGTDIAFASELIGIDPDIWGADATQFDPHRFLRMREAGDLARSQATSISDDMMPFGNGNHSCPGRFLAVDAIKIIIMNLLYRYDFKYPEGISSRPANEDGHHTIFPSTTTALLFKEKKIHSFL
ncbi:cytochrome P450 [Pestalotiopsis sp. NC0098]|nr:cytochrome P450 [Pestalotiopsis sp. NC0098]